VIVFALAASNPLKIPQPAPALALAAARSSAERKKPSYTITMHWAYVTGKRKDCLE